jgi:hypothetical protein
MHALKYCNDLIKKNIYIWSYSNENETHHLPLYIYFFISNTKIQAQENIYKNDSLKILS